MYDGVPSAEPGSVSADPLAELGINARSSAAGPLRSALRLGETPVDDECLAVLADDDVPRLDVAVEHAPAVGVVDRVTDVQEPPQESAQSQRPRAGVALDGFVLVKALDGLLEAFPPNEPHRVERAAVGVGAQAVDRHDARMLQPAGDLGFQQEPLAACRVVGMVVEDLFERDLACSSASTATKTTPRPPCACGRRTRNRWPWTVRGTDTIAWQCGRCGASRRAGA